MEKQARNGKASASWKPDRQVLSDAMTSVCAIRGELCDDVAVFWAGGNQRRTPDRTFDGEGWDLVSDGARGDRLPNTSCLDIGRR